MRNHTYHHICEGLVDHELHRDHMVSDSDSCCAVCNFQKASVATLCQYQGQAQKEINNALGVNKDRLKMNLYLVSHSKT